MFRKMFFVHALIAEADANIINALIAATNQAFEWKLVRNAKIEILVKRVHMRNEWVRIGAASRGFEYWNINLNKAMVI